MIVYEHTTPSFLIWIAVIIALGVGGFSVWRWTKRVTAVYIITGLFTAFLALLLWCMFMPGKKITEKVILKPRFVVILDKSKSMVKLPKDEEETRWQRTQDFLQMSWKDSVSADCDVEVYTFDSEVSSQLAMADIEGIEPDGNGSLLRDALRKITSSYAGLNVAGGVILTDGLDTRETFDDWAVDSRPFPLYTLQLEDDDIWSPEPDLRVDAVQTPKRVTVNWQTELKAVISGQGYPGAVNVQLFRGKELLQEVPTQVPTDGGSRQVQFDLAHPEIGIFTYRIVVPPVPKETNTNDNEYAINVQVIDSKNRLVYIEGAPRWEAKYLKRALQANKKVSPLIFLHGPEGKPITFGETGSMTSDMSPEQLAFFKIIILGNLDSEELGESRAQNIVKYTEDGGSLVLLGGAKGWGLQGFGQSSLKRVLPVKRYRPKPREGEFKVTLTDAGRSHEAFLGDPELWDIIPPILSVFPVSEPTRMARILVVAETDEGKSPVILSQRYGQGKVVAIFTDSLWKWKLHPEAGKAKPYQRFWDQLISWLLPEDEETLKNKLILFADKDAVVMGDEIKLSARMGGDGSMVATGVRCVIKPPDGEDRSFSMQSEPVKTSSGKSYSGFSTAFTATDSSGLHEVVATATVDGREVESDPLSFFVKPFSAEDVPKGINAGVLRSIAESSGATFYKDAEDLSDKLSSLDFQTIEEEKSEFKSLWNTWFMIVLLTAVATAQWILRKINNMP